MGVNGSLGNWESYWEGLAISKDKARHVGLHSVTQLGYLGRWWS